MLESVKSPGQYLHVSKTHYGSYSVYSTRFVIFFGLFSFSFVVCTFVFLLLKQVGKIFKPGRHGILMKENLLNKNETCIVAIAVFYICHHFGQNSE